MSAPRSALAAFVTFALLGVGACGDDDPTPAVSGVPAEPTTTESTTAEEVEEALGSQLTVTVADGSIELSEGRIAGGVVEVTLDNQASGYASADLARVQPGTTPQQFAAQFAPVITGSGPLPGFVLGYASVDTEAGQQREATILLEPGEYIVWSAPEPAEEAAEDAAQAEEEGEDAPEGEAPPEAPVAEDPAAGGEQPQDQQPEEQPEEQQGPSAEDFLMATLTVTEPEGDSPAELPETENSITATDYAFDVQVDGPGRYTFRNEGPSQYHHAVVIDFGTNPVDAVRAGFEQLVTSDGEDVPEGIDPAQIDFSGGDSGVFSPGGAGNFDAFFEEGNTYAVVCFISDRTGGPPHAIAYDMYEIFEAGA